MCAASRDDAEKSNFQSKYLFGDFELINICVKTSEEMFERFDDLNRKTNNKKKYVSSDRVHENVLEALTSLFKKRSKIIGSKKIFNQTFFSNSRLKLSFDMFVQETF